MFSKLIFLLIVPAVFGINLQVSYQQGPCQSANVSTMPFFEMDRFLGEWVEHYRSLLLDDQDDCGKNYYSAFNGTFYNLTETKTNIATGRNTSSAFSVRLAEPLSNPVYGKLLVNNEYGMYYVPLTDYTRYAFVQACEAVNSTHYVLHLWLLGRPGANININEFFIGGTDLLRPTIQDDRCIGIFPNTNTTTVSPTTPDGASAIMVPSVLALLILKAFQMFV
ncbi:CLUMA_CG017407, isoform A [Clunio marinus]|uniref:CLUMA_CG017407, isoform A n=1 Tax=Clunio marinus TaxID=568069 RepID=A0A1J1IVV8_9DIPT|nr:CLUMA_CG017407, isoform A [Clunio marinus]